MAAWRAAWGVAGPSPRDLPYFISPARAPPAATCGEPLETRKLAQPLVNRLGANPTPARSRRHIAENSAECGNLRSFANGYVIHNAGTRSQHHEIFERHTAGDSGLRNHHAMTPDRGIVADLNQIVDL